MLGLTMVARLRPQVAPNETREALVAQLWGPDNQIWPQISLLRAQRQGKKGPETVGEWDISHVANDTPDADADAVLAFCRDHAEEQGSAARYIVTALGTVQAPKAPRGKPQQPDLTNHPLPVQWSARFGSDAVRERSNNDDSAVVRSMVDFNKSIPELYQGALAHVDGAIQIAARGTTTLYTENASLRAENERLRARDDREMEFRFKQMALELEHKAQERRELREDEAAQRAAEAEARRSEAEAAKMAQMLSLATMALDKIMAFKTLEMQFKVSPPPPPKPKENDVAQEINALLLALPDDVREKVSIAFGPKLWNLLVETTEATDNEASVAILLRLKAMFREEPQLMTNLFAAGALLPTETSAKFMTILQRVGVIDMTKPEPETEPKRADDKKP